MTVNTIEAPPLLYGRRTVRDDLGRVSFTLRDVMRWGDITDEQRAKLLDADAIVQAVADDIGRSETPTATTDPEPTLCPMCGQRTAYVQGGLFYCLNRACWFSGVVKEES